MNDVFTARNGTKIETCEKYGGLDVTSSKDVDYLFKKHVDALREWFQAERDKELGRWRDPENPNLVAYRDEANDNSKYGSRCVRVLDESSGRSVSRWEGFTDGDSHNSHVAVHYFTAHPATQPWHYAKPGEAWVIKVDGVERAATVIRYGTVGAAFSWGGYEDPEPVNLPTTDSGITAGRRVWAPDDGDHDE